MNYVSYDGLEGYGTNNSWVLIFHHDSSKGFFSSKKEARYSLNPHKFSLLSRLNEGFKIEGRFEFLLKYPQFTGQNHWTQTVNPVEAQPNEDIGYEGINISWSINYWGGLALSSTERTLIDGSPYADTWFYAIGTVSSSYPNQIPGPYWEYQGVSVINMVDLWIRVNNFALISELIEFTCHSVPLIVTFKSPLFIVLIFLDIFFT